MAATDPRLLRATARRSEPAGEVVLKAERPLRIIRRPPTAADVEVERALWGKHPNPDQAWIEDQWFGVGHRFLRDLLGAVLGVKKPAEFVTKAEPPRPPGWGEVMALFQSPAPAAERLATWETLVDGFTRALLPAQTAQSQAAMWALRSALLDQIGQRVHAVTTPGAWERLFHVLPPAHQKQIEWAQIRGAQFVTRMAADARASVLEALVESQIGGGNHHELSRVLLERLGKLNRDWRRIAITETGMAVASGQLQTALDAGGQWEAIWVAGPKACPFCRSHNGTVLKVVPADAPNLDGRTMVWPGKHNVGRSAHPTRRDGTRRTPDEMWWPCLPAHPNCACVWTLRRVLVSAAAKRAAEQLAAIRARKFEAALAQV